MVTRKDLLQAIRSGSFIPFLNRRHGRLDLQSQVNELTGALFASDLAETFKYIHKLTDKLPPNLTPKERLFVRCWRRGLILIQE